jgi:hypothetical protein
LQSTAATAGVVGDRARELQRLLAHFIGKLALTSQEVASLPRNYLGAQSSLKLPELFNESSGWIEVEWFAGRLHDSMDNHRRAARVFLKPRTEPQKFLAELNQRIRNHEDPLPEMGFAVWTQRP